MFIFNYRPTHPIKLIMSKYKYHTLNHTPQNYIHQQRISRIYDIINGKDQKDSRLTRQTFNNTFSKNKTLASTTFQQDSTLPCIPHSIRNAKIKFNNKQDIQALTTSKELQLNQTLKISMPINNSLPLRKDILQNQRGISLKGSSNKVKYQRTQGYEMHNIEQQQYVPKVKRQKLMKEYMANKIKRHKTLINSEKDRYRVQIESIVSQLTPIEQLYEQQLRMQRVKRRYSHLLHFDKDYYIKLNQHDAFIIF